ncbi:endogenous inhibitor of DNA gyrase (YacG/DUF329 family) [Sphingobium sp. B1D7B]|uniref:DNA gyrase inhibitor YacG n=1 Tax=unclassified Sphingobium TaxID=2611147 RepID=UPI00222560B3|nr:MULTISPECIES: DNA gyrase inhibitor YacG [unclassified Sphingobium]MCW2392020.1 endogenous inhibitor of DNA gyrase (YacG/DUF329 family) [Sphingobium sp. B11D3A]MCW2396586.1 endogenous inhibitor of DNA gyrase (YacG/DUF329 family) [Sphingobium sp. B8D3B]MCW2403727.1 endogenous inhibitor of DNA gyrase (YacG/DUF329 family) [Sphingobium sp. B1D7B]MCW2420103.1 endogenous inhibitor of DNA gyrase (YacG/DUF329 family) [Sphingobium sp. B8D3C]
MPIKNVCPLCRQPSVQEFRPFCSRGCRDRDLIGWMDEGYRVPVRTDDDEDGEGGSAGPANEDGSRG